MNKTPLHDIQVAAGGVAATFGDWERVVLLGDPEAEAEVAHKSAIILDSSSFGKFLISGPDAARAIGRVIPKSIENIPVGAVTHFVTLNEEGRGVDDGVVGRRSNEEFYLTTSTAKSGTFEEWIKTHCEGLDLSYRLQNLSSTMASINLAGPKSREILAELAETDISNDALPFMHMMDADVAGIACTIMRIGFLGELGFELHVPADCAEDIWKRLLEVGEPLGAQATAIMGMSHLRLEKGHIIPGHDTDADATLFEAGMGFAWDKSHTGFVGEDALRALADEPRKRRIVRFKVDGRSSVDPTSVMLAGDREVGKMPSVHYSRVLDQTIGISLAENDPELVIDGKARIKTEDRIVEVDVLKGHSFWDPKGERMKG